MDSFDILHYEAYEGQCVVFSGTREECKNWLKNLPKYYYLDDLTMYSNDAPDVYALFNEE